MLVCAAVKKIFVELYAGLASVSLFINGGHRPPVSRIGSKAGYAETISKILQANECELFLLVDIDPSVVQVLKSLVSQDGRRSVAKTLLGWPQSRELWEQLRMEKFKGHDEAARWLYVTAARRGGIGGFKGKHKLRPNVDGFIPTIASLAERVKNMKLDSSRFEIVHARAGDIESKSGCVVYLDPPYEGRQAYLESKDDVSPTHLFERWRKQGSMVGLSEGVRLELPYVTTHDLTGSRKSQSRITMTKSLQEFLHIGYPRKKGSSVHES